MIRVSQKAMDEAKANGTLDEYMSGQIGGPRFTFKVVDQRGDDVFIVPQIKPAPIVAPPPPEEDLTNLTKLQLELHAREAYGVELDRRMTKENMIADLKERAGL